MNDTALRFILLLGVVSLFADMTYEGARSITGPFLALLGASAAATGLVAGAGEFIGYGLRIVSGMLADRAGHYWTFILWGYALNLLAVPLLALAGRWEIAALVIVIERLGKSIRTPARDAVLSHAAASVGRGWGFAIHEALDQIGAVVGPLIVAAVLHFQGGYRASFALLVIPAVFALCTLIAAQKLYSLPPELHRRSVQPRSASAKGLPRAFWMYLGFVAVSVAGYAPFPLMAYHFKVSALLPDAQIAVLFAVAMGVDALVALLAGRWFDRIGLMTLLAVPLLSLPIAPLAFSLNSGMVWVGAIFWGAVMGIQETVMRAALADMTASERRATAYGIFNAAYGIAWFLGSLLMGILYEVSISSLVVFSIALELLSLPLLLWVRREESHRTAVS
jgi:MFS family permease